MGLVFPQVYRLHRRLCGWVRWFYSVQGTETNFTLLIPLIHSQSSISAYDFLLCFLCAFARFDEWLSLEKEAKAHFISLHISASVSTFISYPGSSGHVFCLFVRARWCDIQRESANSGICQPLCYKWVKPVRVCCILLRHRTLMK